MVLPLLEYTSTSQNQRVAGFEVGSDEQPRIYSTNSLLSAVEMDDLISAAYRQIFNEQQMTASSRQLALESQLRGGQITVRDFVVGLAASDHFRTRNYETNNNYRFVQMCIQRLLGREVYNDREKFAWSTLLATKGLNAFINELVNTDEYLENFGDNTVPYQRRRILPMQTTGMISFAHMARYDEFHRDNLPQAQGGMYANSPYRWAWQSRPNPTLAKAGGAIVWGGAALIGFLALAALFNW